jgi:hypothetical protein
MTYFFKNLFLSRRSSVLHCAYFQPARNLRKTPEADAQGQNRFERAAFMYSKIKSLNSKTNWQLIDVIRK